MKKTLIFGILIISALLLIAGCSKNSNDSESAEKDAGKPQGGEKLESVRAEYSFCYDNGNYDPTLRYTCEQELKYKQCKEWELKEEGASTTFFYAEFLGGEPTTAGWYSNYYYMKVKYADGKELTTDKMAVSKEIPGEFMIHDDTGCYPKGTIEIYNMQDELMAKMSFDYTQQ